MRASPAASAALQVPQSQKFKCGLHGSHTGPLPDRPQTAPTPPGLLQSAPLKSENAECRMANAKPPKATSMRPQSHLKAC